jgi:enoyl-CoA hydratase/carnithine racemase
MNSEVLTSERCGAAQVITITREHAGNSISREVTEAFERAIAPLEHDATLRAVIVTGSGDRFFCSGGDIKQYRDLETRAQLNKAFARPRKLLDHLESLPVPVIAAVNGYALGGGAELMLACDIRLAAPEAKIGFPYVKLSLIPGWHGIERLAQSCGYGVAMHLLTSGEPVTAEDARRLGLVNEVVIDAPVLDAALAFAAGLESAAPLSLAATKRVLRSAFSESRETARQIAEQTFADLWMSKDHREAEAAFSEKRKPKFIGK